MEPRHHPQDNYDRWAPRVKDFLVSIAGLSLIAFEATRLEPSRDVLIIGFLLLVAPRARTRLIDRILGEEHRDEHRN